MTNQIEKPEYFTILVEQGNNGTRVTISLPRHQVPQIIEAAQKWLETGELDERYRKDF